MPQPAWTRLVTIDACPQHTGWAGRTSLVRVWACRHGWRVRISEWVGLPPLQGILFVVFYMNAYADRDMEEPTPGKWRLLAWPCVARARVGRARKAKTIHCTSPEATCPTHNKDTYYICNMKYSHRQAAACRRCATPCRRRPPSPRHLGATGARPAPPPRAQSAPGLPASLHDETSSRHCSRARQGIARRSPGRGAMVGPWALPSQASDALVP